MTGTNQNANGDTGQNTNGNTNGTGTTEYSWGTIIVGLIAMALLICWGITSCGGDDDGGNSQPSETLRGLRPSTALVACKRAAKTRAPYGFDYSVMHTSYEVHDDSIEYVFRDAKIGNAFGGEMTADVYCEVTGTDSSPTVSVFDTVN